MTEIAFLLFVFLKQFYTRSSGNIGLADICMMLCVILLVTDIIRGKRKGISAVEIKKERFFLYFLICIVAVNLFFSVKDQNLEYEKYTLYWLFNGMSIWCFTRLADKKFLKKLNGVCKLNLCVQFGVWISGHGRTFFEYWGGSRYMGTFNDPNQYAFFLFCMILLISLYSCNYPDKTAVVYYGLGAFLMGVSKSTGVFLGLALCTAGLVVWFYIRWRRDGKIAPKTEIVIISIAVVLFIVSIKYVIPSPEFDIKNTEFTILSRIQEKIWKVLYDGNTTMLSDRGMDRIVLYPAYMIWGSGEGNFGRFTAAAQQNEIHCSFLNIWFCYGVLPVIFLLKWLGAKLKKLTAAEWVIVGSLIAESFLLVNYRQPFFWMILLYSHVCQNNQEKAPSALPFYRADAIL